MILTVPSGVLVLDGAAPGIQTAFSIAPAVGLAVLAGSLPVVHLVDLSRHRLGGQLRVIRGGSAGLFDIEGGD